MGRVLLLVSALQLPYLICCQVLGEICLRGYLDALRFLEENGTYGRHEGRQGLLAAFRQQSVRRRLGLVRNSALKVLTWRLAQPPHQRREIKSWSHFTDGETEVSQGPHPLH